MNTKKMLQLVPFLLLVGALLAGMLTVQQTQPARVSAASCAEDAANLLQNGTMAGGSPNTYGVVAKKWNAFIVGATKPNFENALNEGYDPNGSQYIWRDLGTWDAGIYQTVTTLTPGQNYHFWIVWGQALHDVNGSNERATLINRQIGVDPTGGTNPASANVVWTVPYFGGGGFNRAEWNLNFVASGTTATFFLRAQNGHTDGRNKVFFDTACLRAVNGTPTSTPWSPTRTSTQTLAPTATITRTPTQTPIPGTKIDDANTDIKYVGTWGQGADALALNSTYHWARGVKGAAVSASYTFTGTQVTVWYIGYKNRGKARVVVDGVPVGVIDQYTPGVTYNLSQSFYNFSPGAHVLKIRNAGAKNPSATNSIIVLDAIEVPTLVVSNVKASNPYKSIAQVMTFTPTPTVSPTRAARVIPFGLAIPAAPTPDDPSVIWDPRLPGMNVYLQTATVTPGTLYWKLIRADYQDGTQSGGNHNMYYIVTNEQGTPVANQTVWQSWPDDLTSAKTDANGLANIAMWANYWPQNGPGPYNGYVGGLPSDQVRGMGLPANNHVNFIMYFQRTIKSDGNATLTPTPTFTPTQIPNNTSTSTSTLTPTQVPQNTKTPTPTFTPTQVSQNTKTPTPTLTATQVAQNTKTPTPTLTPTPSSKLDDTDTRIAYTAGWGAENDVRAYNSTYHYARGLKGTPARLGYNFTGTQIKIWYIGYKNRGKAVIKIDGVKVGVIDQYAPAVTFDLSQTFSGLKPGPHNLKILNKGAKNVSATDSIIVLDALETPP